MRLSRVLIGIGSPTLVFRVIFWGGSVGDGFLARFWQESYP